MVLLDQFKIRPKLLNEMQWNRGIFLSVAYWKTGQTKLDKAKT